MRFSEKLFYIGMFLLPFAYGSVDSGTPILSIGLPILLIPSLIGIAWLVRGGGVTYRLPIWFWGFFGFSLLTVLSCALSPQIGPSLYRALVNIEIVGILLYVFRLNEKCNNKIIYSRILYILAISGTILSLEYIGHFIYKASLLGFGNVIVDRVVGGEAALNWGATNNIAGCLLITSLIAFALAMEKINDKRNTMFLYSIFIIQALAIVLTFSRTVLFLLLIFSFATIFKRRGWKKFIVFLMLTGFLVVIGFTFFGDGGDAWQELIQNRVDTDTLSSMSGRTEIWVEYLKYVWDSRGVPAGYFSAINLNEFSAHNNYLTLFYELGWIGGLIFLLLVFSALLAALRSPRILHWAVIAAAAINIMVEDLIYLQVYSVYFWLILALVYIWRKSPNLPISHNYVEPSTPIVNVECKH